MKKTLRVGACLNVSASNAPHFWNMFNFQNMDYYHPDSKVHGANMGPTWVLSSPGGPHVGPTNLSGQSYFINQHLDLQSEFETTKFVM